MPEGIALILTLKNAHFWQGSPRISLTVPISLHLGVQGGSLSLIMVPLGEKKCSKTIRMQFVKKRLQQPEEYMKILWSIEGPKLVLGPLKVIIYVSLESLGIDFGDLKSQIRA